MDTKKRSAEEILKRRNQYAHQYKTQHYDRLSVLAPKGKREQLDKVAKKHGLSMSKLLLTAVDEWIENHDK